MTDTNQKLHGLDIIISLEVWKQYEVACEEGFQFVFNTSGIIEEIYYKLHPRNKFMITGYMQKFSSILNLKTEWNGSVRRDN